MLCTTSRMGCYHGNRIFHLPTIQLIQLAGIAAASCAETAKESIQLPLPIIYKGIDNPGKETATVSKLRRLLKKQAGVCVPCVQANHLGQQMVGAGVVAKLLNRQHP